MDREQIIRQLLEGKSTTFASIDYSTRVATAAKHKDVNVQKLVHANVQLFSNINAATSVFKNAVKRSADKLDNDKDSVENFVVQENYFVHTDCYSIVEHRTNGKKYLYAIFNNAQSSYMIDNKPATSEEVIALLTPSAAKKMQDTSGIVYNQANNIQHDVQVRTISLENIISITASKQTVDF